MACTWWPERLLGLDLTFACKYHDWHYKRQQVSRWQADVNLYKRVRDEARASPQLDICISQWRPEGNPYLKVMGVLKFTGRKRAKLIASVMFVGVRTFGWYSWIKNKKEEPFAL